MFNEHHSLYVITSKNEGEMNRTKIFYRSFEICEIKAIYKAIFGK